MKKLIKSILTTALAFTLFSCTNLLERNTDIQENKSANGETYLVIGVTNIKKTTDRNRSAGDPTYTVNPDRNDAVPVNLTNLVLTGRDSGSGSTTMATLVEADTMEELNIKKIKITPGDWIFKLSGEINGVIFSSGEVSKTIKEATTNTVKFTLTSEAKYGGLEITVEWQNVANKVVATLMNVSETETIATKTFTTFDTVDETTSSITFGRDIKKSDEQIQSGTYYLKFEFYNDTTANATDIFDYYDAYVNIADGLITRKTFEIELKKTFEIQYEANGGILAESETQPLKYSLKSTEITLPAMKKPGYFWGGWYENEDLSGETVTAIPTGTGVQKTYYAKWNDPVLYVSGMGDDKTGDGTEANPYETIDKACEEIIATGDSEMAWVIYIMGNVTGPHSSTRKESDRVNSSTGEDNGYSNDYGRSIIPETLTTECAKSILVTGYNTPSSVDSYPQDIINRGLLTVSTYNGAGPALSVATEVPVTITNVKLTNGRNSDTNPNSANESFYNLGGGLGIGENSTVYLGNNVYIEHNKATYGGGIYNAGTLYIYGSACIGDKTIQTVAEGYVYQKNDTTGNFKSSNEYSQGGGVYNKGNLYLGYTRYVSTTDNEPVEWTGGIFRSYGSTGGGLYITNNSTAVMNSGTIAYNDGVSSGGGVTINSGTFIMTGGTICHDSTGGSGGGVKVESNGIFYFGVEDDNDNVTGPTINTNWATGNGGGIYIEGNSSSSSGKVFMFGKAVVGDKTKTSLPTSIVNANQGDGQNATNGGGGGIYTNGYLYMGFSSYNSDSDFTTSELNGGIYYNYTNATGSNSGGGGLYLSGNGKVLMNSGTIANNVAVKKGSAVYIGNDNFVLGGTATIPAGTGTEKQTIFVNTNNYSLNIDSNLSHIANKSMALLPLDNSSNSNTIATTYNTYKPIIKLTSAAASNGLTIDDVKEKFTIESFTDQITGIVTNWTIGSDGKVIKNAVNLYVSSKDKGGSDENDGLSATTPLATLSAAVSKMNDTTLDYIITLNGEIIGTQIISDSSEEKIKANSITIKGANSSSSTNLDIINAESVDTGSALSILTTVPVTINKIKISGGHGTSYDAPIGRRLVGGGLFICDGGTVSIENKTLITGNSINGYGGGVFIANNAKMIMNSNSNVSENNADYGGGIFIAGGGYLRTLKGSGCDICSNEASLAGCGIYLEDDASFDQEGAYIRNNVMNNSVQGSGMYICSNATYRMSGGAEVTTPNDVYMQAGAQIQVVNDGLSTKPAARITPASYPEDGDDPVYPVNIENGKSLSWSTIANYFEITPQIIEGEKQYWFIDKSNNGKMTKKAGMELSVSITPALNPDISVTVTQNGIDVENNAHLTAGIYEFIATPGYSTYSWSIDGEPQTAYNDLNTFTIDTTGWAAGTYDIYLEATKIIDSKTTYYSYTAQLKVSAN